jgi:hypothetical protein
MSKNLVAWQGEVALKKAQWDSANGHTVQFALPDPEGADKANPFKRFTKMRKNKVGTRFEAVIFDTSPEPACVYNDGAMLKGWTDSNTGQTVSFWLANVDGMEHPLSGYREGDTFAVALVEMSDEDAPIDQQKRERGEAVAEELSGKKRHGQLPSQGCALVCGNPDFWGYLNEILEPDAPIKSAAHAAVAVRELLGIESRRELDQSKDVEDQWHKIRRAFVEWSNG